MKNSSEEKSLVIGGGPAGLCAGLGLATRGGTVTLLEKTDRVGGLAQTFRDGNYLFDLGPHIIHTHHEDMLVFIKDILNDNLRRCYPKVKIFYSDKFVHYPLRGKEVFTVLPPHRVIPSVISFILARFRSRLFHPPDDDSFERWIKNRFGSKLYDVYFAPYAQKVWMIRASEISKYVACQKVPELRVSDYFRTLLRKPPRRIHCEDASLMEIYYPRKGIGQLTDWFHTQFVKKRGRVECNIDGLRLRGKNRRVQSVTYRQNGQWKTRETDWVISSMPINELINALDMSVPRDVREAAGRLDYVSEVLLFLKVKKPKLFDAAWVYFSSPDVRFNRVYDVGAFSPECVPAGKSAYCLEFTCNQGDDIWNSTPKELCRHALDVFEKKRIMLASEAEGFLVKKIEQAYPRFRIGFEKRMRTLLDYLSTLENLITIGRQGLFCYANIDDVLSMGLKAVRMIGSGNRKAVDYAELVPEPEFTSGAGGGASGGGGGGASSGGGGAG